MNNETIEIPKELKANEIKVIKRLAEHLLAKKDGTIEQALKDLNLKIKMEEEVIEAYLVNWNAEKCQICGEWKHSDNFDHGDLGDNLETCVECYNAR